jgi:hypothetical protein
MLMYFQRTDKLKKLENSFFASHCDHQLMREAKPNKLRT